MFAVLIDLVPFLTYLGLLALGTVVLVVGFWPWLESPLIAFLEGVRDWRDMRRRRRNFRRAHQRRRWL